MFVFNPNFARSSPCFDSLNTLMYNASQENVESTIVGGRLVYHKGQFACGLDEAAVAAEATRTMRAFLQAHS